MDQQQQQNIQSTQEIKYEQLVTYKGGCHCKKVQFEAKAPQDLVVFKCNCSICEMKQNHHFIIPEQNFKLISGEDNLQCYSFNTHQAKHLFCKTCGIHSFYRPRSNPDGFAVTIYCIENKKDAKSIIYQEYDGQNWEQQYDKIDIKKYSQVN